MTLLYDEVRRRSIYENVQLFITGSAVARHCCCKAHAKINRKIGNSTPCKIVTPKNFNLKLCTLDYVGEMTHHAKFGFSRWSGGFSPNRPNITPLWLFCLTVLSCPYLFSRERAQVEPLNRFSRFMAQTMCFRVRKCFWGLGRWVTSFGENMPQNTPKMGVNRQFQAKTPKYKNRNISKTIHRIKTKFEDRAETNNWTSWVV